MKQLTNDARVDIETAAREIGSVPKDKQSMLARLVEAYKDGLLAGAGLEKETA